MSQATVSRNGKRRELSPMEKCFGRDACVIGSRFEFDFDAGFKGVGTVSKIVRKGKGIEISRITLDFDASSLTVLGLAVRGEMA